MNHHLSEANIATATYILEDSGAWGPQEKNTSRTNNNIPARNSTTNTANDKLRTTLEPTAVTPAIQQS